MLRDERYWQRVHEIADQDDEPTEEEVAEVAAIVAPTLVQIARGIADDLDKLNRQMRGEAA